MIHVKLHNFLLGNRLAIGGLNGDSGGVTVLSGHLVLLSACH